MDMTALREAWYKLAFNIRARMMGLGLPRREELFPQHIA